MIRGKGMVRRALSLEFIFFKTCFPEDLESGLKPGSDFAPPGPKESFYTLFKASRKRKMMLTVIFLGFISSQ